MSILAPGAIERECARTVREAYRLLGRADALRDRIDAAQADGDLRAVEVCTRQLAALARQFTRAQAELVHPSDRRYRVAREVIVYCDEEDRRDPRPTWTDVDDGHSVKVPPLEAA